MKSFHLSIPYHNLIHELQSLDLRGYLCPVKRPTLPERLKISKRWHLKMRTQDFISCCIIPVQEAYIGYT